MPSKSFMSLDRNIPFCENERNTKGGGRILKVSKGNTEYCYYSVVLAFILCLSPAKAMVRNDQTF